VTVQVVAAPDVTLAGAHASEDTLGPALGTTVTDAVVLRPSVALNVTVWDVATAPAVAVNVVEFVVAGTVTEAATGSAVGLFETSVTVLPPVGAARFNVTVHVVVDPEVTLVGLQTSVETAGELGGVPTSDHSTAVDPAHCGSCGVPVAFLSVTSVGRGSRFKYQIAAAPAADDFGDTISEAISARESKPE